MWQAVDPNDDTLMYEIFIKGEDEEDWKLLKDELTLPKYDLATVPLPDGVYRLKVVASDHPDNMKNQALKATRVSDIVTVDNTAPEITMFEARREGDTVIKVEAAARDLTSFISSARYSLNAQDWLYLLPKDQLFDSENETFSFSIRDIEPGEKIISLMVTDAAGNTSVAKKAIR